jgi:ABC-type Mn2+/Zn2+ transport system ATPase subunit
VIRRFYVHNFRCLENFELPIADLRSVLLIGKNGSGKTTVGRALEVLQQIARGTNHVGDLVKPKDLSGGRSEAPMRFAMEVELDGIAYSYSIAFEFPKGFKELRVFEENFLVNGNPVYTRNLAAVALTKIGSDKGATFNIDWHLVALPLIQAKSDSDPLSIFRQWLGSVLIIRPLPAVIRGDSNSETLQPDPQLADLPAWFSGLLAQSPSAYTKIDEYLKQLMPDLKDVINPKTGTDSRSMTVRFSNEHGSASFPFADLSDGEKCFMIGALVLASIEAYQSPVLCFWDEPDNHLALSEIQHFVMELRRAFALRGQFIATSHNPETIRSFSDENTFLLYRNSHLEPTVVRSLEKLQVKGDLVGAISRGDLEP